MALADTAELIIALNLRGDASRGLTRLDAQLRGMRGGLNQVGRGVGEVAGGVARLGAVAGVAAAGGLAAVITTAASFEQAFTGVEKTVDGTDAQLAKLEETLRGMARTMPVSFEELAAIGEAGGALGIARESLDEFVDVVARLAVSTDLSSDQAATALGQLANVLQLEGSEIEDFADSLVALGNAGASTESQIVEMAARFGAAGNTAGLTKEEILALSSAVASMGIEVEAGGSSLSRIFGNIATAIGTGGDEIEAFTDLLGISAKEFQKRFGEDALGTFQDFLEELGKLDQFAQARVLEEAGITGVRDINAVRLMAQNVGFLNEQLEISESATGALGRESDKFFATAMAGWQTFKNIARDSLAVVGEDALPVVNQELRNLGEELNKPEVREGLRAFGRDLAGGLKSLITELKGTDFSGIIGGLKLTAQVAKGAFDAFRALPEPVQQLAIAALVANKVSGGAVGSIAKGLADIFGGALRTITAANVTVIGGNVTGGGPGVPGGGGRGIRGALGRVGQGVRAAGALAAIPLAGVAAVEVINFQEMRNEATGNLEGILNNMRRDSVADTNKSIAAIQQQLNVERPLLEGILFHTNVRPVLERELGELQNLRSAQQRALAQQRYAEASLNTAMRQGQAATVGRLDRTNALLGIVAGKNFGTVINKIDNRVSSTVIQQRTTQSRIISGVRSPTVY